MAVLQTIRLGPLTSPIGVDTFIVDIRFSTATTAATVTVTHGLGFVPLEIQLVALQAAFYPSRWRVILTTLTTQIIQIAKISTASSASDLDQVRLTLKRPHSIGR